MIVKTTLLHSFTVLLFLSQLLLCSSCASAARRHLLRKQGRGTTNVRKAAVMNNQANDQEFDYKKNFEIKRYNDVLSDAILASRCSKVIEWCFSSMLLLSDTGIANTKEAHNHIGIREHLILMVTLWFPDGSPTSWLLRCSPLQFYSKDWVTSPSPSKCPQTSHFFLWP